MRHLIAAMLLVAAVFHLLPLSGVLGGEHLTRLYGATFAEPNLTILMRHRAVILGLLGLFLAAAAIHPPFRAAAFVAGFASVISFLGLAWSVGGYNGQLARVFAADVLVLVCLIIGCLAHLYTSRRRNGVTSD